MHSIVAALLVVLGAAAVGEPCSRWGAANDSELARATRAVACGLIVISYLMLLLGSLGALYPALIAGLLIAPLLVPGQAQRVARLLLAAGQLFGQRLGRGWMGRYSRLALGLLAVCALTPNTHVDVQCYHYAFPQIYLRQASLHWCQANFYEGLVQSVHMLYVASMALGGELAANLLGTMFLILLLSAVMESCAPLHQDAPSVLAFLLLSSPLLLFQGLGGLVDLPVSFYTFMAFAALLQARSSAGQIGWCALWCGAALSGKPSAIIGLVCMGLAIPFWWPGHWLRKVAAVVLASGLMAAPWWIRNYLNTGDPLSPLLVQWQMLNFDWNPMSWLIPPAHAQSLQPGQLTLPLRSWSRLRTLQDAVNPLIWLAPLVLLSKWSQPFRSQRFLLWLSLLPLALLGSHDMRYALPLVLWWSPLVAVALAPKRRFTRLALGLAALPGMAVLSGMVYLRLPVALAIQSKESFLEQRGPQSAYQFLATVQRPGQRVLLLGNMGFRCPLEYYCASAQPLNLLVEPDYDYYVLDIRETSQLNGLMSRASQDNPHPDSAQLCQGPLRDMDPTLLRFWLLHSGLAQATQAGQGLRLNLSPSYRDGRGVTAALNAAWNAPILFSKEGVLVLGRLH